MCRSISVWVFKLLFIVKTNLRSRASLKQCGQVYSYESLIVTYLIIFSNETDFQKCFSDRSMSSSPESVTLEHSPVFRPSHYKTQVNSLPSSPHTNYDLHENMHYTSPLNYIEQEDYDQPLDMSRKRPQEVISESQSTHRQQLRPSVITCASALLRTQCSLSDLAHQMCAANVSDCNSNDIVNDYCSRNHQDNNTDTNEAEDARPGHRREIASGI